MIIKIYPQNGALPRGEILFIRFEQSVFLFLLNMQIMNLLILYLFINIS